MTSHHQGIMDPHILRGALASLLNEREALAPHATAHPTGLGQWSLYIHPQDQHPPTGPVTLQETDDAHTFPAEHAGRKGAPAHRPDDHRRLSR